MDMSSLFGKPLAWENWLTVQLLFWLARRVFSGHECHHVIDCEVSQIVQISQESSAGCRAFLAKFLKGKDMSQSEPSNWERKMNSAVLSFS
jgi:hypothetical protein